MADYSFPWQAWLQAQQARAQNRMAGPQLIGQTLQSGGQDVGQAFQALAQRKKQQDAMKALSSQYPQLATMLNVVPPDQRGSVIAAFVKEQQAPKKPMVNVLVDPSAKEGYKMSIVADDYVPKKPGQKVVQMPAEQAIARETAEASGGSRQGFFNTRASQITLGELPSNMAMNTAPGAAYQVKVAARQGKSIIAKATTPQAIALASADLGRAVQRSAPLAETIGAADYANNLTTQWNKLTQKLTSDPKSKDIPKIRKALYDQFNELDKAAEPWISNQLKEMKRKGMDVDEEDENIQLGKNIPDIPFIEFPDSQGGTFMSPKTQDDGFTPLPGGGSYRVK